jgi:murein DD-endopeptidase MepM/ murein hydrolase activator NlpD
MNKFIELLQTQTDVKVLDTTIEYSNYTAIDLSSTKTDFLNLNLLDAASFEEYIENYLNKNDAKIAFGGYLEKRNLYKRSAAFKNATSDERNIHIGLDLWIKAGTNVLAALDGTIHSYQNNYAIGDYGPTIILEHTIDDFKFYTLYGHLNLESLNNKNVGDKIKKGQQIGQLGSPPINGDYAPHLHFQIIKDIQNKIGDYPGVCSEKDIEFYTQNCPDPNILLK